MSHHWSQFGPPLTYAIAFSIACLLLKATTGVLTFGLATVGVVTLLLIVREAARLLAQTFGRRPALRGFDRLTLLAGGMLGALVLLEAGLHLLSLFTTVPRWAPRVGADLVMPEAWKRQWVHIEGTRAAYYWHGHLHVYNRDKMRLIGDFPPKRPGVFRIMALGDSLTFGPGIAQKDTYPAVLERHLGERFRAEVLNLGVEGYHTEDVHRVLQKKLPVLQPDLVLYGVFFNNFLPSRVGQYETTPRCAVPVPYKSHFIQQTLLGYLLERKYDALLIRLGIRDDLFGDILRDFAGYQVRFARDVRAMNDLILQAGLPPLVAMVLDNYLDPTGKSFAVGRVAERLLTQGGIRVIPSEPYIRQHAGHMQDWRVSPWEGHPNEQANRVYATEFARVLEQLPALRPYCRAGC